MELGRQKFLGDLAKKTAQGSRGDALRLVEPYARRARLEPRRFGGTGETLLGRLSTLGAQSVLRVAAWRGRRAAQRDLRRPLTQSYRAFIQVNFVRPG